MNSHVVGTVTDPDTGLTRATCTCGRPFRPHRSPTVASSLADIHRTIAGS